VAPVANGYIKGPRIDAESDISKQRLALVYHTHRRTEMRCMFHYVDDFPRCRV